MKEEEEEEEEEEEMAATAANDDRKQGAHGKGALITQYSALVLLLIFCLLFLV